PFALICVDEVLDHLLKFGTNAELVADDDVLEMLNAPFEFLEPDGRARQAVGRHDVIGEEAVDVFDRRLFVDVGGKQVRMPRLRAAVSADVQVVTVLGGDEAEVLPLRLGTLADATGDGRLHLVRGANALVAVLDADGEGDGILHAVPAPGRAHAALDRAERFAVRVAAFETG